MITEKLLQITKTLPTGVKLVAVSKFQPVESIKEAYAAGHRQFGENRPQELVQKYGELPKDIEWHMIGRLQTNKVRMIVPFVSLIHSVDSMKLLEEIDKEALKSGRVVEILLQAHIAQEQTKQGFLISEIDEILSGQYLVTMTGVRVVGLMGMATFTEETSQVEHEFRTLAELYHRHTDLKVLSMGMSEDYILAIECGSNMVRVGSAIFGTR